MTELAEAISSSLLRFLWQGALAGAACAVVLSLMRRSANARYLVACCGLAAMAAIPVVDTVAALQHSRPTPLLVTANATSTPVRSVGATPLDGIENWTLRIWAAGVLLFGLRLAVSYGHVARLRKTGEVAGAELRARVSELAGRMGVLRPVTVLVSRVADSPSVTGWLRPAILMPAAVLAGLDAGQLEAILAHELAHIRRHDYLVNLMQTVVETLLFYHPAVWWLSARIRRERECCCDDLAVRYCGGALGYARSLASLERLRSAPVLTPAANSGPLLFRIRRLMGEGEAAPSKAPAVAAALVAALCIAANVHWAHAQVRDTADVLSRAPLEYPEAARAKGIEGTVVAEVTLDGQGNVTDARVVSGPAELRKAALASVLDWRFNHAAAGEVRLPIEFHTGMESSRELGLLISDTVKESASQLEQEIVRQSQDSLASAQAANLQQDHAQLEKLRAELVALQAKLAEEQKGLAEQQTGVAFRNKRFYFDASSGGAVPDRQIADVEAALAEAQSHLADSEKVYGPNSPTLKDALANLQALEKRLAELRSTAGLGGQVRFDDLSGHRISRIRVSPAEGAPNETPADLPLHLGDEWNAESMAKLQKWAQAKTANPSYQFTISSNGDIELLILMR